MMMYTIVDDAQRTTRSILVGIQMSLLLLLALGQSHRRPIRKGVRGATILVGGMQY